MSGQVSQLSDMDVSFIDTGYGKNFVRLLYVRRQDTVHYAKEIEVSTQLRLDSKRDFIYGDNSAIVATDTQKNTVYSLAKQKGVRCIDEFASQLCEHFLSQYTHVNRAKVYIDEHPWRRLKVNGKEHAHAFVKTSDGTRFCEVTYHRGGEKQHVAGVKDLTVLKTTQSAFVNFHRDQYRSLPDMEDRIFSTVVRCQWAYSSTAWLDFCQTWTKVNQCIVDVFAGPPDSGVFSPSVQKTIYDTLKLAMATVPQIAEIEMELPNVHMYEFDFNKLPKLNIGENNEVFVPTDKPSGNIKAALTRKQISAKL